MERIIQKKFVKDKREAIVVVSLKMTKWSYL
jgi:hypothetical protein